MSLGKWLKDQGIPALEMKCTRELAQKLRTHGVMLGKIQFDPINDKSLAFEDPNLRNLVEEVSTKTILEVPADIKTKNTVVVIDCGAKTNIIRRIARRGINVVVVPANTDVTKLGISFQAVVISNGPGDPAKAEATIRNVKKILDKKIPTLGICLGNQILALAEGGTTFKLKYGHRSQNQPCIETGTNSAYLTTQNHGFAVKKIPNGYREWFYNANDGTNEGIIHKHLPFMSVQFHPESSPGPLDTDWIFDFFFKKAGITKS